MFDDQESEDLNLPYLKGARQDPPPWETGQGPSTAPMAALTPPMLEEMDRRVVGPLPEPQERAERRPTRMQERRLRKVARRRFVLALGVAALGMVVAGFIIGQRFL